jgi:acylphosphatase
MKRILLKITGRVQGVGFRYSALDQARHLGLTGWVRNTHDGAVELVAEGAEEPLHRLVAWCRIGPPGGRVTHVDTQWAPYTGEFESFRIAH